MVETAETDAEGRERGHWSGGGEVPPQAEVFGQRPQREQSCPSARAGSFVGAGWPGLELLLQELVFGWTEALVSRV